MKMIETFDQYVLERYKPLEIEYLQRTNDRLNDELETIRKYCLNEWRKAIKAAVEYQNDHEVECAYMSISFLLTSMLELKPQMQIDFYNSEWVYGESWFRRRMNAEFLTKEWNDFTAAALDERFYIRSRIAHAEIKSLFWSTLDKLIYLFSGFVKYFARNVEYFVEFDELNKSEKFYLTFGTYLDWQDRMFGILPEIDFLNLDANEETRFRKIIKKNFNDESFIKIDMRHCYIEDCKFVNCTFDGDDLIDSNFLSCRFEKTNFVNVKLVGSEFFECYFNECRFENCSVEIETNEEYFAKMRMYHCFILKCEIVDSNFDLIIKKDCYER